MARVLVRGPVRQRDRSESNEGLRNVGNAANRSAFTRWVDGVTYNVYRCKKDGTHCRKIAPNIAADTYKDTHVKAGQEYRYKVTAVKMLW
jgi:hypothetical protein